MTLDEQQKVLWSVRDLVAQHPDAIAQVMSYATAGQKDHIESLQHQLNMTSRGWMTALSVMQASRVDEGLRAELKKSLLPVLARWGEEAVAHDCKLVRDAYAEIKSESGQ